MEWAQISTKGSCKMNKELEHLVSGLLGDADEHGHGMSHIERVVAMALAFAEKEGADSRIVMLAAYLHEVDDYKIFGETYAAELINAREILARLEVDANTQERVLDIIKNMGYSKYLKGIRPSSLEGQIVSDADMCDALGVTGILRTHDFGRSKGRVFFDASVAPARLEVSSEAYKKKDGQHSTQHFFDKLLLLPGIMMTKSGREEAAKRQNIMIAFLENLFREEGSQVWLDYLKQFLEEHKLVR